MVGDSGRSTWEPPARQEPEGRGSVSQASGVSPDTEPEPLMRWGHERASE